MSHTQKRFLAALVGLVVAASIGVSFSLLIVMTTVSSLVSDIMVASLIIIVPAAFGVIVWELLQRRAQPGSARPGPVSVKICIKILIISNSRPTRLPEPVSGKIFIRIILISRFRLARPGPGQFL